MQKLTGTKKTLSLSSIQSSCDCICKGQITDFVVVTILVIGFLYIFVSYGPSSVNRPIFFSPQKCLSELTSPKFNMTIYKDQLDKILAKTAMPNKTLIIAVVNKAYVEGDKPMLDLFMDGFWLGEGTQTLRNHLLIVAVDQTAYERCKFLRLRCFKLETDGVNFEGEEMFMSNDFINMMWRRTLFLGDVLKRGYNFIFTDTDVLWLRNPFPRLSQNETIDLQISVDAFNGQEWSESNPINTGFYMIRSNNKTIGLFDSWYSQKDNSTGMKEQDVLVKLMQENLFEHLGIKVLFLDTIYFSGFCQDSKDVRAVATVHANCCKSISAKVADLTAVVHDWKRLRKLRANETETFGWSRHIACQNSWNP